MTFEGFDALIDEFASDTRERLSRVEELLVDIDTVDVEDRREAFNRVKSELHTVKGNAGMMGFANLQQLAHSMEDRLGKEGENLNLVGMLKEVDAFRAALKATVKQAVGADDDGTESFPEDAGADEELSTVRVSFATLDALIDQLADMVMLRNRLTEVVCRGRALNPAAIDFATQSREAWSDLRLAHELLVRTLDQLQDRVMHLRLVPLRSVFGSLKRLVYDEARNEGKDVQLQVAGGETPLDKALFELANEALGHLVRNAIIHGLETPDARKLSGKPLTGTVRVSASARSEEVQIVVSDDGAGIDGDALLETARNQGIDTSSLDDPYSVLFMPGFSTKTQATLGAGRGVGLSAVAEAVRRQGGETQVESVPGKGTEFRLVLPLSVSIARALVLSVDGEEYALPLHAVVESKRLQPGYRHQVNHAGVFRWRGHLIPLLDLGHHFGTADAIREDGYLIVIEAAGKHRGLVADHIKGIQEVVVKGVDPILGDVPGIGGTTVLGDGRAILILDPRSLAVAQPFVRKSA